MSNVLSIRGRIEALKHLHGKSDDMTEKTVLHNVIHMYAELHTQYGLDVIYKIPDDKIFLNAHERHEFAQFGEDGITEKIFEVIKGVAAQGVTILLVEQNAKLALQAAHRCYVMDSGVISMSGPAQDMLHDPRVREAYLGEAPG
jgi:hypothetical protein